MDHDERPTAPPAPDPTTIQPPVPVPSVRGRHLAVARVIRPAQTPPAWQPLTEPPVRPAAPPPAQTAAVRPPPAEPPLQPGAPRPVQPAPAWPPPPAGAEPTGPLAQPGGEAARSETARWRSVRTHAPHGDEDGPSAIGRLVALVITLGLAWALGMAIVVWLIVFLTSR